MWVAILPSFGRRFGRFLVVGGVTADADEATTALASGSIHSMQAPLTMTVCDDRRLIRGSTFRSPGAAHRAHWKSARGSRRRGLAARFGYSPADAHWPRRG